VYRCGYIDEMKVDSWEVDRKLVGCSARRAALDLEEANWLRIADQESTYLDLGYPTMIAYMEARLGYSPKVAVERLRVAKALDHLPAVAGSLDGNRLGYSAARELTRVATLETEGAWVKACEGKTLREIESLISGREKGDLPTDPARPSLVKKTVRFDVLPDVYALFREARRALQAQLGHSVTDEDLFAEMCRGVIGNAARGDDSGRAAHQIALGVCEICEAGTQDGAGVVVDVSAAVVEQARCDAQELGRVDEEPGRATQTIPPRIRRAVWRRDHGRCQVPGCRSSRFLQLHHLKRRADGGQHVMSNLVLVCGAHHRLIHDDAIALTGTPGALAVEHLSLRGMSDDEVARLMDWTRCIEADASSA
jgi:hypothetical protein